MTDVLPVQWLRGAPGKLMCVIGDSDRAFFFHNIFSEEETVQNQQQQIEADTSKYYTVHDRILAAAECIKAQRAGKKVEVRHRSEPDGSWGNASTMWNCNSSLLDYRVKREPFVTSEIRYRIRANVHLTTPQEYLTRREALDALGRLGGPCAVDMVVITLHDGKEVSREVAEALR